MISENNQMTIETGKLIEIEGHYGTISQITKGKGYVTVTLTTTITLAPGDDITLQGIAGTIQGLRPANDAVTLILE